MYPDVKATVAMERFMEDHPEIVYADHDSTDNTFRVIVVCGGDEYAGAADNMTDAYEAAMWKGKGR